MNDSPYRWEMTEANAPLARAEFDPYPIPDREVLVKVAGCGVCHTDLGFLYDGIKLKHAMPLALGHEISGRVVDAGKGAADWIGKAVVVLSVIPCGKCKACQAGYARTCHEQRMPGNDIHGGFASHIVVPLRGLCPVDESRLTTAGIELADLSVVADAVTTPLQAVIGSGLRAGDLAIVNGVGGVGGFAVQIAAAVGATVIAVDVNQMKLDKLARFGAAKTINASGMQGRDLKKTIGQFAESKGLPQFGWRIFECSGTAAGQSNSFDLLTFGATLCIVGFTMEKVEVRLSNLMAFDARVIGNWGCVPELYPDAIDLVLSGKVALKPFTEARPLDDINAVFDAAHAGTLDRRAIMIPASAVGREGGDV